MTVKDPARVLTGKVALITGAGRVGGIGRATALALARDGASVVGTDLPSPTVNRGERISRDESVGWRGLSSLLDELAGLGAEAMAVSGDVSNRDDVKRMVGEVLDRFGRIDILFNNAGAPVGLDRDVLWNVPDEAFDLVMAVNVKGPFLMCSEVVPHMIAADTGYGRIINTSSNSGRQPMRGMAPYSASKAAVLGLTGSLALEVAEYGITVNAILPGRVNTARSDFLSRNEPQLDTEPQTIEQLDAMKDRQAKRVVPVGRFGTAAEMAGLVRYLCLPEAGYITGQGIVIDGGMVLH